MQHHSYDDDYKSLAIHPYKLMLTLILAGVIMLFIGFSLGYGYTVVTNDLKPIELPWIFVLNTGILLASSYTITRANKAYLDDDTEAYKKALYYTILLTGLFMLMQTIGWGLLFQQNVEQAQGPVKPYLYLLSALHFAHVLAGLPFLLLFYRVAKKRMQEPVSVLVYFSDPEKRLKLRLLTVYWHFLDALWIALILLFVVFWFVG